MATTFQECPKKIEAMAKRLMTDNPELRDLLEADVTIAFLFARNDDGAAIMHHGWPARGVARKNNLRDRVAGLPDATIVLDEAWWEGASEGQQVALLDHELLHLTVARNQAGSIKYDDANRPKLKIRLHDFQFGGFHSMVQRHGTDSGEAEAVEHVVQRWEQLQFAWK